MEDCVLKEGRKEDAKDNARPEMGRRWVCGPWPDCLS